MNAPTAQKPGNEANRMVVPSAAMSSSSSSSSVSPAAKRRRLLSDDTTTSLERLPFETVLGIASFLEAGDALTLSCVKGILGKASESLAYWKQIATILDRSSVPEKIVSSLMSKAPKMKMTDFCAIYEECEEAEEAGIWRQYALSRSMVVSQELSDMPENPPTLWSRNAEGKYYVKPGQCRPKPLGAYSFLLEMELVRDGPGDNKKCSVFLESIESESKMGKKYFEESCLRFQMPNNYLAEYFPWVEDYEDSLDEDRRCELDTTFTIYAIDRVSGNHAKIYHSGRKASLVSEERWGFECQIFRQPTTNPVPFLWGVIDDPWKQGEFGGLENKSLALYLSLFNPDDDTFEHGTIGENILLFLEKVNVYV